jgi:hypothetical protein
MEPILRPSPAVLANNSPFGSRTNLISRQDENDNHISPGSIRSASSTVYSLSLEKQLPEPPYHVFSSRKKKCLMYLVSVAGIFSSLSSNIYFPALGQISRVSLPPFQKK